MVEAPPAGDRMQVATPEELATAREARGMSQVDISQRIKLQVKQVKALEEGDWDALPGRSFVRGALRSYGKLIDVDVAPLLESIGGFAEPTQVEGIAQLDAPIARSSGLGFNGGGRGSPILWVIAGLIGVVALVLYFGSERDGSGAGSWLRPDVETPADAGSPAAAQPAATPQGGVDAPAAGSGDAPGGAAPNGSSAAPAPGSPAQPAAPPPSGASSSLAPESTPAAPGALGQPGTATSSNGATLSSASAPAGGAGSSSAPVESSGTAQSNGTAQLNGTAQSNGSAPPGLSAPSPMVPAPAPATASTPPAAALAGAQAPSGGSGSAASTEIAPLASASASESAGAGSAATPAPVDPKGLIRLEAGSQDSWIEVRQADGTALHNGLVKAGESIELKGTPPYRLVLGNASHLSLTYEGKARDLGPHMRANNIARLQLR